MEVPIHLAKHWDFSSEEWAFLCVQQGRKWLSTPGAFEVEQTDGNRLGTGSFGVVFQGRYNGRTVACKVHHALMQPDLFGLDNADNMKGVLSETLKEMRILATLKKHQNILEFIGVAFYHDEAHGLNVPVWIITAVAVKRTLHERIYAGITPTQIEEYAKDLSKGLKHLHEQGVVHRDIKPKHLLLMDDDRLVIAGFHLAKIGEPDENSTQCGTPSYLGPEGSGFSKPPRDVYAAGCVILECVLQESPRIGIRAEQIQCAVDKIQVASPRLAHAIKSAMQEDPDSRPSAEFLLAPPPQAEQQQAHPAGLSQEPLVKAQQRRDDLEAKVEVLPNDTIQWMWGDAGILTHSLSSMNPHRWSTAKNPMETIAELHELRQQQRPVDVIVNRAGREVWRTQFKTVPDAMLALGVQAESVIVESESEPKQINTLLQLLQSIKPLLQDENAELVAKVADLEAKQADVAHQKSALQAMQDLHVQLKEQLRQKENAYAEEERKKEEKNTDGDMCMAKEERDNLAKKVADMEADLARMMKSPRFEEGEDVFVWSESHQKWEPGVVAKVFAADTAHEGWCVSAAILVQYDGRQKEILGPLISSTVRKDLPEPPEPPPYRMLSKEIPQEAVSGLSRIKTEPSQADIRPFDRVQWMWGNAGLLGSSSVVARLNPLRWSDWKQLDATIKELGAKAKEDKIRPVRIRTNRDPVMIDFNTVQDALRTLEQQAKEDEIYSSFSKLYCFVGNGWEERGTGTAKLLKSHSNGQVRFMFEQENTMKTLSNHLVVDVDPFCNFLRNDNGDRCRVWTAQEFIENADVWKVETVALKFCTPKQAIVFEAEFMKAKHLVKSA